MNKEQRKRYNKLAPKMTREEYDEHIRKNSKDTYSMAVELSALYMKLYGEMPKIGLSGMQVEFVERMVPKLPTP